MTSIRASVLHEDGKAEKYAAEDSSQAETSTGQKVAGCGTCARRASRGSTAKAGDGDPVCSRAGGGLGGGHGGEDGGVA